MLVLVSLLLTFNSGIYPSTLTNISFVEED